MFKNYLDQHLPKRVITGVLVSIAFVVIPQIITDFYFHYLDRTTYITITQPVSIDKKVYSPCDKVILTTQLTAIIDVDVKSLTQLILIRQDGSNTRIGGSILADIPIRTLSAHVVSGALKLPCDLDDGRYFWQGNATYFVHGYQRTTSFISDTFVVQHLTSEDLMWVATQSGDLK